LWQHWVCFFRQDQKYEGQFSKGKFHGYGVFEQGNMKYEGQFEDGKIQGLGDNTVSYACITFYYYYLLLLHLREF